jgi:hypothetical protein
MIGAGAVSVPDLRRANRLRVLALGVFSVMGALLAGLFAGTLASGGHSIAVVALFGITILVIIWRRPEVGVILILVAATTIEQFRYSVKDFTDFVPFYASLSDGVGLKGVYLNPLELTLVVVAVIWLMKAVANRTVRLPRSHLAAGFAIMLGIALLAEMHGLASRGDFKASLWELRPWVYVSAAYLLTTQLVTTRTAIRAVLWTFVIGTGFKSIQGVILLFATRHVIPRPESILAHEESVFFSLFIVLVAALWLYREKGRLRAVATAFLPTVIGADLGNTRRAAWLILGACLIALAVIVWVQIPDRRRVIKRVAVMTAVVSLVYIPIFWNHGGIVGQPARAIRAAVSPDARDRSSDRYRKLEDANLALAIKRSTPFGQGFGVPINYEIPIIDISGIDPSIKFIPHDGILYVWMRFGFPGELAFWWLIGSAMLAALWLARSRDRQLALIGTLAVCAVIAYVLEGKYDLGLSWFRIALFTGILLGVMESARHLAERADDTAAPAKAEARRRRLAA